ncbi:hypothetical protein [Streptomyces sp. ODS28]|uniref:hypothetical protein n=1 Tax=Streptomyces sp. ODS28 TaxID=3136688 RepID=UPI0031EF3B71
MPASAEDHGGDPAARPGDGPAAQPGEDPVARSRRRRRTALTAGAWVASVVVAGVLGAWSFAHAEPGGRYERPKPLGDAAVRHELVQEKQRAARGEGAMGSGESTKSPQSGQSSGASSGTPFVGPAVTVRFPGGAGTASVRCERHVEEDDGRKKTEEQVRLLSVIPAEGYSVDDVDHGPDKAVKAELEPADDDADDLTVAVRCADGKPHTSVVPEDGDDD